MRNSKQILKNKWIRYNIGTYYREFYSPSKRIKITMDYRLHSNGKYYWFAKKYIKNSNNRYMLDDNSLSMGGRNQVYDSIDIHIKNLIKRGRGD